MIFFKNKNFSALNPERGVSLIVTFFIMIVILIIVASLSIILYSEVKIMRNMGNSVVSFYVAESGIEKVLYYDRQVLPEILPPGADCSTEDCPLGQTCVDNFCRTYVSRGLCSMFDSVNNSSNFCKDQTASGYDGSIYCNNTIPDLADFTGTCSRDNCTDCTIYFTTQFDDNRSYDTTATIDSDGNFEVNSGGTFGNTQRRINISISNSGAQGSAPAQAPPAPAPAPLDMPPLACILNEFISDNSGPTINSAEAVLDGNGKMTITSNVTGDIDYVQANMYIDIDGNCTKVTESIDLQAKGSGTYSKPWTAGTVGETYYILMDVRDNSLRHTYLRLDPITLE